jgi:hypothetical protein
MQEGRHLAHISGCGVGWVVSDQQVAVMLDKAAQRHELADLQLLEVANATGQHLQLNKLMCNLLIKELQLYQIKLDVLQSPVPLGDLLANLSEHDGWGRFGAQIDGIGEMLGVFFNAHGRR